jgi:hypothetical protein
LLKDLGYEKPEDLKSALKSLKDLQDAGKTEKEKLEARLKELEPKANRHDAVTTMLNGLVETQFNKLPEAVRKAIDAKANGDADKRLEAISLLEASGLLNPAVPAPAVPPGPSPVPPPASVTPSPAPPPSGAPSKFQEWELMKARHPIAGDIFYQQNTTEIERTRPAA